MEETKDQRKAKEEDKWLAEVKRTVVAVNAVRSKVWRITCSPTQWMEIGLTADKTAARFSIFDEEGCASSIVLPYAAFLALKDSVWDLDLQPVKPQGVEDAETHAQKEDS